MNKATSNKTVLVITPKTMIKAGFYGTLGSTLAHICITATVTIIENVKKYKEKKAEVIAEEKENAECDA